jgi:MoxR-like ATPase
VVTVDDVKAAAERIRQEIRKVITGQSDTVDLMLTALFAGGHILLEGPPGTAKTLIARCFSQALGIAYGRIQFTPDLMPGDIVGSNIYNYQTGQFTLTRGPIFCDLLLADEINRTPPKTQAALLEAMQEHAVTFDGTTHSLGENFMVVATQNPIEHQGVYPLPEAQLDRFLFKHRVSYPSADEERAIIVQHGGGAPSQKLESYKIEPQIDGAGLQAALATVGSVTLVDEVVGYISALVRATRENPELEVGASPRAGVMLARAARARAALDGRAYVIPDDVKALAVPALRHRVILSPAAQIDGRLVEQIVAGLVDVTAVPR